ncbi:regulatory protein RecX [Pistricoccus aurantiacus]|uniref:Regulatory protein RecX n=1 Tax=Pistricoccus aurantiacus TaxID=1883414 RepID=A0A5B8T150_9GAMM|nr:regulatory protein RecX [Pistricoccus aurantiacus]QEA40783.1 regulatory protein RecX [Pistricoccus aurantiacus]
MASSATKTIEDDAIRLLARREYSRAELAGRLAAKGHDSREVHECLDDLAARGLQSDARFAESFLRSRLSRGQGALKIRGELQQRGVDRELIGDTLANTEVDWFALACDTLARRFDSPGDTPRERARRERFLAGRGFDFEQVRHALSHAWEERE